MWRSKLGKNYDKSFMDKNEYSFKAELERLRTLPENRVCADCGSNGAIWASVNLGVFSCLRCGSIYRGLGTHVSLPKGCTGTYLCGPDELERMRLIGDNQARKLYGGDEHRPSPDSSDEMWTKFILNKYENRKFVVTQPALCSLPSMTTVVLPATNLGQIFSHEPIPVLAKTKAVDVTKKDLISFDSNETDAKEFFSELFAVY